MQAVTVPPRQPTVRARDPGRSAPAAGDRRRRRRGRAGGCPPGASCSPATSAGGTASSARWSPRTCPCCWSSGSSRGLGRARAAGAARAGRGAARRRRAGPPGAGCSRCAATLALLTCSAVLVHTFDGVTELHFHYFVAVAVVALYQDWVVYAVAVGFVVLQHGLMGTTDGWGWALVHAGFVLAEAAGARAVLARQRGDPGRAGAHAARPAAGPDQRAGPARGDRPDPQRPHRHGQPRVPHAADRHPGGGADPAQARRPPRPGRPRAAAARRPRPAGAAVPAAGEHADRRAGDRHRPERRPPRSTRSPPRWRCWPARPGRTARRSRCWSSPARPPGSTGRPCTRCWPTSSTTPSSTAPRARSRCVAGGRDDSGVWLTVSNEGTTLDSDEARRLFEPFTQVDSGLDPAARGPRHGPVRRAPAGRGARRRRSRCAARAAGPRSSCGCGAASSARPAAAGASSRRLETRRRPGCRRRTSAGPRRRRAAAAGRRRRPRRGSVKRLTSAPAENSASSASSDRQQQAGAAEQVGQHRHQGAEREGDEGRAGGHPRRGQVVRVDAELLAGVHPPDLLGVGGQLPGDLARRSPASTPRLRKMPASSASSASGTRRSSAFSISISARVSSVWRGDGDVLPRRHRERAGGQPGEAGEHDGVRRRRRRPRPRRSARCC